MVAVIIVAILVFLVLLFVLSRERIERRKVASIVLFLLYGALSVGWFGTGLAVIIQHYLTKSFVPTEGGAGVGFGWFLVLTGLYILRQWFGVIFSRAGTGWYDDLC